MLRNNQFNYVFVTWIMLFKPFKAAYIANFLPYSFRYQKKLKNGRLSWKSLKVAGIEPRAAWFTADTRPPPAPLLNFLDVAAMLLFWLFLMSFSTTVLAGLQLRFAQGLVPHFTLVHYLLESLAILNTSILANPGLLELSSFWQSQVATSFPLQFCLRDQQTL